MCKNYFKKAFGLLLIDIVVIIGIFIIQFRTNTSIIEKIGNLNILFSKVENATNPNDFYFESNISYNGIKFSFDQKKSAVIVFDDGSFSQVKLLNWEKSSDLSYNFIFENDVLVEVFLENENPNSPLSISAKLPENIVDLLIPFSPSTNMTLTEENQRKMSLESKKAKWEIIADSFELSDSLKNHYFRLNKKNNIAKYAVYEKEREFTFENLVEIIQTDSLTYERNVIEFKNKLINTYQSNNVENEISEQVTVSYIAAMAENGDYSKAVENVQQVFKKKTKTRTYLSAPYLNSLDEMNKSLEKIVLDYENRLSAEVISSSLDLFTIKNIAFFMSIHKKQNEIQQILKNTLKFDINNASLSQVAGILQVYVELSTYNKSLAIILEPVLMNCIERIEKCCNFDGKNLTISENDTFLSVIQGVELGVLIMRFGIISNNQVLQNTGYIISNSYLNGSYSFDLRTLANIYPILAYNNWYYPHFKIANIPNSDDFIWAWTCAKNITFEKSNTESLLKIDFPETKTHYLILNRIPQFVNIYIYDMQFRTDPRFETYNSSGYVYKNKTETLLLKSKHRKQLEEIRFSYVKDEPKIEETKIEEDSKVENQINEITEIQTEEKNNTENIVNLGN